MRVKGAKLNGNLLCWLKKYWILITLIFGFAAWHTTVNIGLASQKEINVRQSEQIQGLQELVQQNTQLTRSIDGKLDVILLLMSKRPVDTTTSGR